MRGNQGFSAIEVLIVIIVAGLLYAQANLSAIGKTHLREQALEVQAFLEASWQAALRYQETIRIEAHSALIERLRQEHDPPTTESLMLKGRCVFSAPKSLTMHPNGVASPATLVITSGADSCALSVSLRGRVMVSC